MHLRKSICNLHRKAKLESVLSIYRRKIEMGINREILKTQKYTKTQKYKQIIQKHKQIIIISTL